MMHIKLFEEYHNGVNLLVKFHDYDIYIKAVEYFKTKSDFMPDDYNSEFRSISFFCTDQEDADTTEIVISEALDNEGINGYYFESE
jgi:hypothetical protein